MITKKGWKQFQLFWFIMGALDRCLYIRYNLGIQEENTSAWR